MFAFRPIPTYRVFRWLLTMTLVTSNTPGKIHSSQKKSKAPQMRLANLNAAMPWQCVAIPCPPIFTFEEPQLRLVFQNTPNWTFWRNILLNWSDHSEKLILMRGATTAAPLTNQEISIFLTNEQQLRLPQWKLSNLPIQIHLWCHYTLPGRYECAHEIVFLMC